MGGRASTDSDTLTEADMTDEERDQTDDQAEEKHSLKEELRGAVAKAVGIAAEAGSMLSGHSGEMVSAEGKVAEADTEKFIDSIDGEE
jgi:hypothetical protein